MSIANVIPSYLPSLRRYARAILGSQLSGDSAVLAALQWISLTGLTAVDDKGLRVELYRALLQVCNGTAGDQLKILQDSAPAASYDQTIACMSPQTRQAFLLTAMEGCSIDETCAIMDVSEVSLRILLRIAHDEISSQTETNVMIIEDEVFIARSLANIVQTLGHKIYAKPRTRTEALAAFKADQPPGLILADICLADGSSGMETVNEILRQAPIPAIFITAYPSLLLTGARPEPTFLVAKPFTADELRAVISQVLFFKTASKPAGKAAPSPIVTIPDQAKLAAVGDYPEMFVPLVHESYHA